MSCVAGKQGLNPLPSWETVERPTLFEVGNNRWIPTHFWSNDCRMKAREVLLWNRMKAKSFVTKDLVTLGIYQFDSSRLAWSTKIHSGHSNLTSPRRKVQEAPCWCDELHQITRWSCCCGPFPFQNLPPKKYLRGVEHAIPAVHSRRGYSVISVGSLGFWSRYIHHSFKENEFIVMYESTVDFKKSWEHFRSFFFLVAPTKQHICNMWDQGWIKWGNFCKAAWSSLEDQRWEDFLSINFRGEIADLPKKIPAGCRADPSKTARLANFVKAPGKLRHFFLETWWKDYCTLQHVFDWVELNQSMSCHKQILEGRCFLSGEVQTFAQFPRYLVESQVFTLYMFPLKSCKKSPGTPDFPQQESHLPHREVVWAANPPRTGVANLHPAPKTCLFLGNEAPVRRTNSDPERWGTPRLTRTDDAVRRLTGDCCRFYGCPMKQHIYIYTYIHINTYTS